MDVINKKADKNEKDIVYVKNIENTYKEQTTRYGNMIELMQIDIVKVQKKNTDIAS